MTVLEDRMEGFTVNDYHDLPIILNDDLKNMSNRAARMRAIWAIRHPNKMMPTMDRVRMQILTWLMQQKVEFIPIVENPDPTQLDGFWAEKEGEE